MKFKHLILSLLIVSSGTIQAQEGDLTRDDRDALAASIELEQDSIWNFGGTVGLNFNQSYFSNWAAGGQNSISATALTSLFANYKKNKHSWTNTLDLAYGLIAQDGQEAIKTDDRIDFTSKYGLQSKKEAWYYSALFNFRTQFAEGFTIEDGEEVGKPISDFLAPAYSILAAGVDYKPNEKFSAFLSPVTSKITIVTVDRLAPEFGVDEGENVRFEVGAFVKLSYKDDIFENVNLDTRVDLFSNYVENPQNVDVNWETLITMKINDWLSATLTTQLIYDDDIIVGFEEATIDDETGEILNPGKAGGPRTQFREVFALGLSFSL
ncbi:MAG: DUF3078 domain-containing protein [Flavobacteriales bacterium]|nr:DUF3078 domain-containing protein [Flavobacteriales bacterium]